MNKYLLLIVAAFGLLWIAGRADAQEYHTTIKKELQFNGSAPHKLNIWNINGSVTVEGYDGTTVQIVAKKTVSADNNQDVQQGVRELNLKTEQNGSDIDIYIDAPFVTIRREGGDFNYNICGDWDQKYQFNYDLTIKVPRNTTLRASTINHGDVKVTDVQGNVEAKNVNGGLDLEHIAGITHARTVNGTITASFSSDPGNGSDFETINGTIRLTVPKGLSADLSYDTMNGDLYTDFPNVRVMPASLKVNKDKYGRRGIEYRINKTSTLRIGNGGPQYKFKTLNGNIYIKQD